LQSQTIDNPLLKAIQNQTKWLINNNDPPGILMQINPFRPFKMWYNNRIMHQYLVPHVEKSIYNQAETANYKTITSLAAKAYSSEVKSSSNSEQIDPKFVDMAISQLKIFIFAGHETTASALCYAYHLLQTNPETLSKIRLEHDTVLGPNCGEATAKIKSSPHILNQLPYTAGVIKEVLRLFPPVGTVRQGQAGFFLTQPDSGVRYPTEGFMLFGCSTAVQRNGAFWERPDDFVPERWMAREGDPLHVRKNAYRPFELGPRNCIGQELAQLELRAILALTVRELDVKGAYQEDGGRVLGELAYQVLEPGDLTGHPAGGMPVTVAIRS
jgi:hypothetical protein